MNGITYDLSGKVAVVTGGSRGIGLEIADALLQQGAQVAICGRKLDGLNSAKAILNGGDNLLALQAHVAQEADVERLFDTVVEKFGTVDILVNNVGMNLMSASLIDTDLAVWQRIIDGNLTGAFLCSRRAGAIMREKKRGKIVSISSLAATRATPGMSVYGIAKAALEMMTKVLGAELAPFNIQANAISPGLVKTNFSKLFWSSPELAELIVKEIPAGRISEPSDLVHSVLFLCSGCSDFITGQTIAVDGGASIV
jgi:NAD(P)-dependent dehydrogenase (short-subunit alcohol dehydrogenase family)